MPPPIQAKPSDQEGRLLLAIQAIQLGQYKSIRKAAASYNISWERIYNRINGIPLQ